MQESNIILYKNKLYLIYDHSLEFNLDGLFSRYKLYPCDMLHKKIIYKKSDCSTVLVGFGENVPFIRHNKYYYKETLSIFKDGQETVEVKRKKIKSRRDLL